MKHKKDTTNVKSASKAAKSSGDNTIKSTRDSKSASSDGHQDIVKRLMTHSQYFPSNHNSKPVTVTYTAPPMAYHQVSYAMTPQYPAYSQQMPQMYTADYYSKDFYYQQHQQTYNQFPNISTHPSCFSPSLSSPSAHNIDQISNGSPSNDYIFNGDFTLNFNADFDGSFPLIDGAKTQQLYDNQAPVEVKSFEAFGQLTPVKIESQENDEIKNSFIDAGSNQTKLVNLSDDDVLSNVSCSSRPSPSAVVDWSFVEQQ